jgi:hypothetical protein
MPIVLDFKGNEHDDDDDGKLLIIAQTFTARADKTLKLSHKKPFPSKFYERNPMLTRIMTCSQQRAFHYFMIRAREGPFAVVVVARPFSPLRKRERRRKNWKMRRILCERLFDLTKLRLLISLFLSQRFQAQWTLKQRATAAAGTTLDYS